MTRMFKSKILVCRECEEEFVFTADAQIYFEGKGLKYPPKRCKSCHIESKRHERILSPEIQDPDSADSGIRPA